MYARFIRLGWLAALVVAGGVGVWFYQERFSPQREISRLQEEKRQLEEFVGRLTAERRVAEILVTDQETVDGKLQTDLLFVEYDKAGVPLPAKAFRIEGDQVHIDAMVIKFDRGLIREDDPLRGQSIALFTRLYGDYQKPDEAHRIDTPGQIPAVYRGADPRVSEFERGLWADFWRLAEDKAYRESKGVRVAQGEGVWGPFKPGRLYTLTLEADGDLNLASEPVKGIYLEALRRRMREG